jgi:hypothetical protein
MTPEEHIQQAELKIRWWRSIIAKKPITIQVFDKCRREWVVIKDPSWDSINTYREKPKPFEGWVATADCYRTQEDASRAMGDTFHRLIHVREVEE